MRQVLFIPGCMRLSLAKRDTIVFKHPSISILQILSGFVITVTVLAILSGCTQSTSTDQTPIKIGYSASLTGSLSADGHALQQGFELWRDIVNQHGGLLGRPVQLIGLDDKSSPVNVKA